MEEEKPVSFLRESTRNLLKVTRRHLRENESDSRRGLTFDRTSVQSISDKLKTSSSISVNELKFLNNALLDDEANREIVLSTHGALRGIIRELTGNDVSKQCEAAACCCNLALSDERPCLLISKAAGSYLVTGADSFSVELAVLSLQAIGNLAASGSNVCDILVAQGGLYKLISVLCSNRTDLYDVAMYGLIHFVDNMKENLSDEHLQSLVRICSTITHSQAVYLMFLLSLHPNFIATNEINENFLQQLLQSIFLSKDQLDTYTDECRLTYIIRLLANLCVDVKLCNYVANYLYVNNFSEYFKMVSGYKFVYIPLLWLLGNLIKFTTDTVVKDKLFETLL